MRLAWKNSDLDCFGATGAQLAVFAGGLQITVMNLTHKYKPCKLWRISFNNGKKDPPFPALRRKFRTRAEAKRAVEVVMTPVVKLAPKIVRARVQTTLEF